jgi:hypothetical protein
LTITALDTYGNTEPGYTGDKTTIKFSGAGNGPNGTVPTVTNKSGTAVNFGTNETITFTSGVATVSSGSNGVMKLYKIESPSIVVSDGSINNGNGLSVTVSVGAAASLSLSAASTTPTAGSGDNLTITALDAGGNTATGYTGDKTTINFSGASTIGTNIPTVTDKSGAAVNFGTNETITFTSGVATVSSGSNGVMKLYKAETASITVSDGSINNNANPLSVIVSSGTQALFFGTACSSFKVKKGNMTTTTITRGTDSFGNSVSVSGTPAVILSGSNGSWSGTVSFASGSATATNSVTWTNGASSGPTASPTASATGFVAATCSYVITN